MDILRLDGMEMSIRGISHFLDHEVDCKGKALEFSIQYTKNPKAY
tara:strand:- start:267 stop:401 length:135 start_codon:yes stop_codon:yes gene_type:complete